MREKKKQTMAYVAHKTDGERGAFKDGLTSMKTVEECQRLFHHASGKVGQGESQNSTKSVAEEKQKNIFSFLLYFLSLLLPKSLKMSRRVDREDFNTQIV